MAAWLAPSSQKDPGAHPVASGSGSLPEGGHGAQMLPSTWGRTGLGCPWGGFAPARVSWKLLHSRAPLCCHLGLSPHVRQERAWTLREIWNLDTAPAGQSQSISCAFRPQPPPSPLSSEAQGESGGGAGSRKSQQLPDTAHQSDARVQRPAGPRAGSWASFTNLMVPSLSSQEGEGLRTDSADVLSGGQGVVSTDLCAKTQGGLRGLWGSG